MISKKLKYIKNIYFGVIYKNINMNTLKTISQKLLLVNILHNYLLQQLSESTYMPQNEEWIWKNHITNGKF